MKTPSQGENWEEQLQVALGDPPIPDFNQWCDQQPAALAVMTTMRSVDRVPAERQPSRSSWKWATASVMAVVGLCWLASGNGSLSKSAFAEQMPGIDNVQMMTWTTTFYLRSTSSDGQRTWLKPERRLHAYRHPGQYRETFLNETGQPQMIQITDTRAGRMLALDLRTKKATLKVPSPLPDVRGPFAWVGDQLRERLRVKSVSLQGQKLIDNKMANVVRATYLSGDGQTTYRNDFLFDAESKSLVGCWVADEKDFDPDTAADRNRPAEETAKVTWCVGSLRHEISLNPKLNTTDFSLDPPAGFTLETTAKPTITEEEMIDYLGAAARFNDNQFPDSPFAAIETHKLNAAWDKTPADRSTVEQRMIDLDDKFKRREIYEPPVLRFANDQTASKSLVYVGAGVKYGEADRIVCWYMPHNASKYRAIYGDLSVKDLTAKQLPLNLPK